MSSFNGLEIITAAWVGFGVILGIIEKLTRPEMRK